MEFQLHTAFFLLMTLGAVMGQNLPRNVRPVVCTVPGTGQDLCKNSKCQTVAAGTTACICNQGTVPSQFSLLECVDFNECAYFKDICRAGAYGRCINEIGDYRCECDTRYYRTAGREHYCERNVNNNLLSSPFGQYLLFGNLMDNMEF